jgi:diaminobutyrate-2-oxoglutarate transaminase
MAAGLDLSQRPNARTLAKRAQELCFERGLIIELCGRDDVVIKAMPPLTISDEDLRRGCAILGESVRDACKEMDR